MGFNTLAALICSISIVTSAARSLVITAAMVYWSQAQARAVVLQGRGGSTPQGPGAGGKLTPQNRFTLRMNQPRGSEP